MNEEVTGALCGTQKFDKEALAKLGRIALAGQKITDVMEKTGLSRSTISKLLNQKMSGPPSVDTLRKLAGDENSPLFRKMLEACGHSVEWQDELCAFRGVVHQMESASEPHFIERPWSSTEAMGALVGALEAKNVGTQYQIDYRPGECFAVTTDKNGQRIIGVPVVVNEGDFDAREVIRTAIKGLTQSIAYWGLSDMVTLLLTNSAAAFYVLKSMPNLSRNMAVLLVSKNGNGFQDQATVVPAEKNSQETATFPFKLV